VTYLCSFVGAIDLGSLQTIQSTFSPWSSPACEALLASVQARLTELSSGSEAHSEGVFMEVDTCRNPTKVSRIHSSIRRVVPSMQDGIADDLASMTDEDLVNHVLWLVRNGFPKYAPLWCIDP
jgi:hypothetical protein